MRADLESVFLLESQKLRQSSHRAVLIEDFANDGGGIEPRQASQIDGGLGVSSSPQDAARFALQRKNVAWLHELTRERVTAGQDLNGGCAIP